MAPTKKSTSKPAGKFKVSGGGSGKMHKFGGAAAQQPGGSAVTSKSGKGAAFPEGRAFGEDARLHRGQAAEVGPLEPELMARTPRASVSKTSGQGVSRLSYQKGRALGGKTGGGASTGIDASFGKSELGSSRNSYAKADKPAEAGGFNVSYGDTLMPTDLADVKALGEGPMPKQTNLKPGKPKTWPKK